MHNDVKKILEELCTHYWLIKGWQIFKEVISSCNKCRRLEGIRYFPPLTAQLAQFRLEDQHPFSSVELQLYVREPNTRSASLKVYTALYTCATTRAVYLKLTTSMTTQVVLQRFRTFVGKQGSPKLIASDNFKSFKPAAGKLEALFGAPEVESFFSERRNEWRFNLAKAPFWEGFFERMVKSTKRCLKKQLGNAKLTFEESITVLIEKEAILNWRPLTYIYAENTEEPLTPSHLLSGR
ncbi:uncharacterized protein [Montipora capricornis]|uniref:uncharacterized protein n=1 Tax=Montipora capricornis TaxID=246305 RepID=UPI0035F20BEC